MDLLPSEIARLVWAYLSDFKELKSEAEAFLHKCPDLRELSRHLKRGGRVCSRKVNEKTLQDHLNDINKPAVTTIEFDEQRLICSVTSSIEKSLKPKLSQLSQKADLERQQKIIEKNLEELIEKHCSFDNLRKTIDEQYSNMQQLLRDIIEQNSKLESGVKSFNEQINRLINSNETAMTSFQEAVSRQSISAKPIDHSNDFKYLEGKLKVEIANKSQYVTSFILNEFVNLKNLLESIVASNYERIQQSTSHLKEDGQRSQNTSHLPLGQETPPSETCRNEPEMSAMNTPTSSELCSQSPSYSELSLSDLISENARADLNRQISQAVCMAATNQPEKYAGLITNVLYKSNANGQQAGFFFTPQKASNSSDGLAVPQTPSLQELTSATTGNLCLNFNLVKLIDDILQSNSPLKNCLGPKCAQLSTQKLFPATPDITLESQSEFKKPDPIVKNFAQIIKTPKPKEISIDSEKHDAVANVEKESENVSDKNEGGNKVSDEKKSKTSPQQKNSEQKEDVSGEILDDDANSDDFSELTNSERISIPAPVFANQHMVSTTTIERLPSSPVKSSNVSPLNDLTKSYENTQEKCFKKPVSAKENRGSNRGRGHKFASSQEQIRHSLAIRSGTQQQQQQDVQQQHCNQVQSVVSQPQVLVQDLTNNVVYAIDPNQTLFCVNDLNRNTYLQQTNGLDIYYQQAVDDSLITTASLSTSAANISVDSTSPAPGSGKASAISATTVGTISVSTFNGSPVQVSSNLNTSNSVSITEENTEPDEHETVENDGAKPFSKALKTRKRKKTNDDDEKESDKRSGKQSKSAENVILCPDFDKFLRYNQKQSQT